MEITPTRLKELFHYDPITGSLTWRVSKGRARAGSKAGSVRKDGYVQVRISGKFYYVHRIAWAIMTGSWPDHLVDHRNTNPSDNRWENLRAATITQNHANKYGYSETGFKGVRPDKKKWMARIGVNGKTRYIGSFDTPEEANAAYLEAATRNFGEYARG
ncbi:MAG TPA: HNH endonuclease [Fluviicoccus sp.]|nr:HNH endonuclease [Fluviicoccus sp.]